ncbi:MAG: glycoside hydrolase family 15 protein [Nanoarchaeota archaeon]
MNKKIEDLWKTSKEVISDCCLENGAIVAANSTKPYFPKEAKNYFFVWPRDAFYICTAAKLLGLSAGEKFFRWCMGAEDWEKTGLFYEKYFIDGRKARHHFQPDQTGSILIALYNYCKDFKEKNEDKQPFSLKQSFTQKQSFILKFKRLISGCANGLCRIWDKDHFSIVTEDLWEERLCFPDLKENFTYSLAICCRGLLSANEIIPTKRWLETAEEMEKTLLSSFDNYFFRSFSRRDEIKEIHRINDTRVDASLLGLVWPAELVKAGDKRMKKTVKLMEEKLVQNYGVHRYEHDEYDGWMYEKDTCRRKGAGYWPLLNFWIAIYFAESYLIEKNGQDKKGRSENEEKERSKNKKNALKYYYKVLGDLGNKKYIPEQFFDNNIQVSVSPLCWSQAMFVIATEKLQILEKK